MLGEPGPGAGEIRRILQAAARVPDHKKLAPWRFVVLEGEARAKFGDRVAAVFQREDPQGSSEVRLETERERFLRAPVVIAVVSRIIPEKVPEIEQRLSTGAVCMNLCLAANALGYGTSWITEWTAFSPGVKQVLGLGENEDVAGFIYIGTASEQQADRDRPDVDEITTHWQAPAQG